MNEFTVGSATHLVCVVVGILIAAIVGIYARRHPSREAGLRQFVIYGCLITWLATVCFLLVPSRFSWETSLPIQFCNVANLIAAMAVRFRWRWAQTILYFWSFGLCICAFLTPTLTEGIRSVEFWVFWSYHNFILIGVAFVLMVDRYRPNFRDTGYAILGTGSYMTLLAILNYFTQWNYGFVGPAIPGTPTLLDVLGPYPLRLLTMFGIGVGIFVFLTLPWIRTTRVTPEESPL